MEVEFRNVTIVIGGVKEAKEAYDALCNHLALIESDGAGGKGDLGVEWETDTFVTRDDGGSLESQSEEQSTSVLWPKEY